MKIVKISFLLIFIGFIIYSHATPEMAIRSRVLWMSHPIDRATGGELDTYVVSKKLWFYFARFEKDV